MTMTRFANSGARLTRAERKEMRKALTYLRAELATTRPKQEELEINAFLKACGKQPARRSLRAVMEAEAARQAASLEANRHVW